MEFFSNVGGDSLEPSLFELVAQEQLRDLLQPAVKYVLAIFAQQYPRYLIRIVNRHEEFYAAMMVVIEQYYLRKYNASFAENFYGMKRRRRPYIDISRAQSAVGGVPAGEQLRKGDIWRSLFFLVGLPYLRAKAQDYFEQLGGGLNNDILEDGESSRQVGEQTFRMKLQRGFKAIYPYVNLGFELWLAAYNVAYVLGRTPFYRPWLSWIGVDLRRLGAEDYRAAIAANPPSNVSQGLLKRIFDALKRSPHALLDSLRLLLPTAIFFIKFLEWWYSPNSPAKALSVSPLGPVIPPPRMLPPHPQGVFVDPEHYGQCPLCEKAINNATALPSGYVFCYRCIHDYVDENHQCPVTLQPSRITQLRKVLV